MKLYLLAAGFFLIASASHATDEHGPDAPDSTFPSHAFQLRAHTPERVQLTFHSGLSQPIFLHGFNAAMDLRYQRFVVSYSHGQGLEVTDFLTSVEKNAGMTLREPWSTGGGVGLTIIDELWFLVDFKVHHFVAETPASSAEYTNVTLGGELGWRYFIWKGFNIGLVLRYWPQIYSSAGSGITLEGKSGETFRHAPLQQGLDGFFGNVLVGWAFSL